MYAGVPSTEPDVVSSTSATPHKIVFGTTKVGGRLVLWGKTSSVGKRFAEPLALWRQRAEDVRGEALPSGHYVNEEAPEQVLEWFLRFFDR